MKNIHRSLVWLAAMAATTPLIAAVPRIAGAETKKHEPKYPIADARSKALAEVPGGTIVAEEMEYENKLWIYSFEIKPKGEKGKSIKVVNIDADTGALISVDTEED